MSWRQAGPRARFGGCTAREMRPSIPLLRRRAISPPRFRASEASSLTADPHPQDRLGEDYDAPGRLSFQVLQQLGVPRQADFYLCGPPEFLRSFTQDLTGWGVANGQVHQEVFGPEESVTPGISKAPARTAASAGGSRGARPDGLVRPEQSRCAMESCIPEPAGICRSLRRSREVGVPDGSLPYVRVRIDRRVGAVRPGAARSPGGRECADLLLPPRDGGGVRSLKRGGVSAMRSRGPQFTTRTCPGDWRRLPAFGPGTAERADAAVHWVYSVICWLAVRCATRYSECPISGR